MSRIQPVILSGGVGSRLWPLSRALFPKQLLPLAGDQSLLQDTVLRVRDDQFTGPIVICNAEHRFLIGEQMRAVDVTPAAILLEPEGRNTAPAAALAALRAAQDDPDTILLLMPADHIVRDEKVFLAAVQVAVQAAMNNKLVTFGITPRGPETGYGYIQRGAALAGHDAIFSVSRFVEKPDETTAEGYLRDGGYYWNSGIFAFKASAFLAELERFEPQMLEACRAALAQGRADLGFFRLDEQAFKSCPANSIDYAVMEHTRSAAVVPVSMGWDDIGSWQALWETADKDSAGNALRGDVLQTGAEGNYLRTEGPLLAAVGVKDLVVVATKDAVLVSTKAAAQDVKKIVAQLAQTGRELHVTHRRVNRPWGDYESLDSGEKFQVKRITVNPGAKLSLQMHHKRAEHWIVVSGTAQVTCGEKVFTLNENESTYIPLGAKHRLENIGPGPLQLIEVQSGSYLGEDDIVRFEDIYAR